MQCPYCNQEMVRGHIFGDRYSLKYLPENKGLFLGIWAAGGEIVGGHVSGRAAVVCHKCTHCNKILIDCSEEPHHE